MRRLIWVFVLGRPALQQVLSLHWIVTTVTPPTQMSRIVTKPTKSHVRPTKTKISLGIRPVWSVFAVCLKKARILSYPLSAKQGSDQTWRMPRLIWVFAWRTCHFVGFVTMRLKYEVLSPFAIFFGDLFSTLYKFYVLTDCRNPSVFYSS